MSDFRPIPTPLSQRWREIRIQGIPVFVFVAAVVAVVFLWEREIAPPAIDGEVHGVFSAVNAPEDGALVELGVSEFQDVRAGEVVGRFAVMPEERVQAAIAVLQAEIELTRRGAFDPILDQHRNLLNWQGLRQDWLEARAELAGLRVRARFAEREYNRMRSLYERDQIPASEHDRAEAEFEALTAQKAELSDLVDSLERAVNQSPLGTEDEDNPLAAGMRMTLEWQDQRLRKLEADLMPVVLRAPISGVVTKIHRREGEIVPAGEPVAEIRAREANHIVGYLRQPMTVELKEGMPVEIALRGNRRERARAEILRIGPQFEVLDPAFQRPFRDRVERGLPLMISLPKELGLIPGELVEVRLLGPE